MRKQTSRKRPRDSMARSANIELGAQVQCPIVGIGASAGGLEAFKQLFEMVPTDTGMAFVLIQHLDPSHTSFLSTALAVTTKMPVAEVEDGTRAEPNHVYVIPPN